MVSRFFQYIDKVFGFSGVLDTLEDGRIMPQIPTAAVWLCAFVMFATRRGSLNAIETDLRVPKRVDGLVGARKPSADTIGRVLGLMEPEALRAMLSGINHQLGRNKVLQNHWPLRFVSVDGHEFFSLPSSSL